MKVELKFYYSIMKGIINYYLISIIKVLLVTFFNIMNKMKLGNNH